jgi:ketosteroid isomerase-like protein
MKKMSALLLVGILAAGVSSVRADDQTDLKALDSKLTEAFKTKDLELLGKHMADDYILVDPRGGLHDKKQFLKHISEGEAKFKELKETDVKVTVYGDTGVVTGLLHVKGQYEKKDVAAEYRWSRVYNKKGADWKCVFEQHTYILPKEAGKQ